MPRRRFRRRLLLLAAVVVSAAAAVAAGLPALGTWLVVADPLVPSDAIFVLEGYSPSREVEAAALYHRRFAPVIALSRARDSQDIARRLAGMPPGQDVARGVLRNLGVPEGAILPLEPEIRTRTRSLRSSPRCPARGGSGA